jgi:hypothetical protein
LNADEIAHYIQQLNSPNEESYLALLTDSTAEDVPALIAAYDAERDVKVRVKLIEIIGQKRAPESLNFLALALQRHQPEIWKTALAGIVVVGGEPAQAVLKAEKKRLYTNLSADIAYRTGFIDEAIEQISSGSAT